MSPAGTSRTGWTGEGGGGGGGYRALLGSWKQTLVQCTCNTYVVICSLGLAAELPQLCCRCTAPGHLLEGSSRVYRVQGSGQCETGEGGSAGRQGLVHWDQGRVQLTLGLQCICNTVVAMSCSSNCRRLSQHCCRCTAPIHLLTHMGVPEASWHPFEPF